MKSDNWLAVRLPDIKQGILRSSINYKSDIWVKSKKKFLMLLSGWASLMWFLHNWYSQSGMPPYFSPTYFSDARIACIVLSNFKHGSKFTHIIQDSQVFFMSYCFVLLVGKNYLKKKRNAIMKYITSHLTERKFPKCMVSYCDRCRNQLIKIIN